MNIQIERYVKCRGIPTMVEFCIQKCEHFNHVDEYTNQLVCNRKVKNISREGKYNNILKNVEFGDSREVKI